MNIKHINCLHYFGKFGFKCQRETWRNGFTWLTLIASCSTSESRSSRVSPKSPGNEDENFPIKNPKTFKHLNFHHETKTFSIQNAVICARLEIFAFFKLYFFLIWCKLNSLNILVNSSKLKFKQLKHVFLLIPYKKNFEF